MLIENQDEEEKNEERASREIHRDSQTRGNPFQIEAHNGARLIKDQLL